MIGGFTLASHQVIENDKIRPQWPNLVNPGERGLFGRVDLANLADRVEA